jgi:ATP-dependent RNA helicase DHX8/PRP22
MVSSDHLIIMECTICLDEHDFKDLFFVDACGHMFCNDCMEMQVKVKVTDGELDINCPNIKCEILLGYYEIKHLLRNDNETDGKYERFLYQKSIEDLDDVVWCPQAHCGSAVPIYPGNRMAKCINCNFKFCMNCRDELHENTCEWNKKWKGKLDSFEAWQEAHADNLKKCPKCNYLTQKIAGCSRMTCAKCKVSFCWECGQEIKGNGHYDVPRGCINTYKKDKAKEKEKPVYYDSSDSDDYLDDSSSSDDW